jgi:hypothetical protein
MLMGARTNDQSSKISRRIAIVALIIGVIGLSIVFAVVTSRLTINGVARVAEPEWHIELANATGNISGSTQLNQLTLDSNHQTITFDVTFAKPGDTATIEFSAVNNGDVDAKLANLNGFTSSRDQLAQEYVDLKWHYVGGSHDGETPATGDALLTNSTQKIHLDLTYNPPDDQPTAGAGAMRSVAISLDYVQLD